MIVRIQGDLIRRRREELKMSQVDLAKKVKISAAYLCDIEHGRKGTEKTSGRICLALFNSNSFEEAGDLFEITFNDQGWHLDAVIETNFPIIWNEISLQTFLTK